MYNLRTITFQKAVEVVESFPEEQQEVLIDIVQHRLIEQRREKLAQNIKKARREYAKGEVRRGTIDDLMKEIS